MRNFVRRNDIAGHLCIPTFTITCSAIVATVMLLSIPVVAKAGIIWSGDFDNGNFMNYHKADCDVNTANFPQIPEYGRPEPINLETGQTYRSPGDGSLLSLVSTIQDGGKTLSPRSGAYAAKFTVKNSINGSEPADCDASKPDQCHRRRTMLATRLMQARCYQAHAYMSTVWESVSILLPSDLEIGAAGFGITLTNKKQLNAGANSIFAIKLEPGTWRIKHKWTNIQWPDNSQIPPEQHMHYTASYPSAGKWPDGLRDFPESESQASLGYINRGGWTDWIYQTRYDARGSADGGTGFIRIWKRDDNGPFKDQWIHVLNIVPKVTRRGGKTFDHGIGYNEPASSSYLGGFGADYGPYLGKERVWDNERNMVFYFDNIKVADENSSFADMSPDGSTPGGTVAKRPKPPELLTVQ